MRDRQWGRSGLALEFLIIYGIEFFGGCERDVVHRMNDGYRAWGALKSVLSNRGLGIKAKKCLYEGVIVPMALYRAEAWGMTVLEFGCHHGGII